MKKEKIKIACVELKIIILYELATNINIYKKSIIHSSSIYKSAVQFIISLYDFDAFPMSN